MWGDLFHPYNLKLLSKLLKRSEESVLEIVTAEENKYLFEYIKPEKIYKIEQISTEGFVNVDFQSRIDKNLKSIDNVQRIVIRRKSFEEDAEREEAHSIRLSNEFNR